MSDTAKRFSTPRAGQIATDASRDNSLWLQLWRDQQQSGFHQLVVNPLLKQCWPMLNIPAGSRVLAPLCGKSLDMLWLAEQGYHVVGIELSTVAVKAFFAENNLKAQKKRIGNFIRWRAGNIVIWCGDFFSLSKQQLGHIDIVFDRAALTALPADLRRQYLDQLKNLAGMDTSIVLLTIEDIEANSSQASKPIDEELAELCTGHYQIELLHKQTVALSGQDNCSGNTQAKIYRLFSS